MLILTRKIGENITIGETIRIHIIDVKGRQVRLGIEAPTETTIYREEIYQKILKENQLAAQIEQTSLDRMIEKKEVNSKIGN